MTRNLLFPAAGLAVLLSTAAAAPQKPAAKPAGPAPTKVGKVQPPRCPGGGSRLLKTTKDREHTVGVKLQGKTYFVCQPCAAMMKAQRKSAVKPPQK